MKEYRAGTKTQPLINDNQPKNVTYHWKVKMLVAQLCLTLCDPVEYSLPGFSVHGIDRLLCPWDRQASLSMG